MKVTGLSASAQIVCYDAQSVDAGLLQSSSRKGSYLLKDGSISAQTVYNQECGIFIDEHLYIPLKMSKQLLTAREAEIYYRSLGKKIPDLYQVIRFKQAVEEINTSLKRIGMQEFVFPADILHQIWYEEALKDAKSGDMRRCVVISGYENYQKPSYLQIDKDCLLFADTILYRRTEECYEPISPILNFSWSGIDFLSAAIGETNYDFYRKKDLKLVYLGKNMNIRLLDHELIGTSDTLYQSLDGKLHKISSFSDDMSYSRHNDTQKVVISSYNEYIMEGIVESAWYDETYFQKNENGLFVKVDQKSVDIY